MNYESEASSYKGKLTAETSNPLTIEKLANQIPKIPKGVLKK